MLDVEQLLAKLDALVGSTVTVEDTFYHNGVKAYLKGEKDPILQVIHHSLDDNLRKKVAAYGGGRFLYRDKSYLVGRLDIGQDGQPFLHEIEIMKLMDEGEYVDVIGGAG